MSNKLIKAGNSRLKKAADSAVDPAVPAELQHNPSSDDAAPGEAGQQELSAFAHGRVISADDVTGTPEEQLAYVTDRLVEIDVAGKRAEDFVVLNKAALLEVAQERELHLVAGQSNFAQWASGVLGVEQKYVFELLKDAKRIRSVSMLGPELSQHLVRASARKVMADVITQQGLEAAQVVMNEGLSQAAQQGLKRPTAKQLAAIAHDLATPSIPQQDRQKGQTVPAPVAPQVPPAIAALERAVTCLRERVYSALAPSAVSAAFDADPASTLDRLEEVDAELQRVAKRLSAAQRKAASAEHTESAAV
ncbi:hypothetical protein [Streptomyces tendae]|uniref:hypothetical protein n=1 Tax=Streptomyces tendae TaxID=1932 RepID=UPI003D7161F0